MNFGIRCSRSRRARRVLATSILRGGCVFVPYVSFDFCRWRDSGRVCELMNLLPPLRQADEIHAAIEDLVGFNALSEPATELINAPETYFDGTYQLYSPHHFSCALPDILAAFPSTCRRTALMTGPVSCIPPIISAVIPTTF